MAILLRNGADVARRGVAENRDAQNARYRSRGLNVNCERAQRCQGKVRPDPLVARDRKG